MKKICMVVTVSMTVDQFLRFSFEQLHKEGYEISIIADMSNEYLQTLPEYVRAYPVKMSRGIDPVGMISAVWKMWRIFSKEKYDLVQYSTPNASLYASIASFASRVPVRLYAQWGLVFQSFSGIKRKVFYWIEKLVCKLSTDVQPDSPGNLKYCRDNHFYSESKSRVVWNGSANGVDLKKFDVSKKEEYRAQIREKYGINDSDFVIGYVGRVGKEKGFEELMAMFDLLNSSFPNLKLLYVGPNEKPDTVAEKYLSFFEKCINVIYTGGWVDDTERYYAAMDVFVFPTYHEGFGSVTIEAEAMGVPVIVSDVPGPQDAILDGITGFKVSPKDSKALAEKCKIFIESPNLVTQMGSEAVRFVRAYFDSQILLDKIVDNRDWLLDGRRDSK